MTEADRVFEECAASPDDDAPRLVWADLVGGERGELVVLQCDLARGGLAPREVAQRRRRERALLDHHAVAWATDVAAIAKRWSFRRGFVEAAVIEAPRFDVSVLERMPLLRSITIELEARSPMPPARYLDTLRAFGVIGSPDPTWLSELADAVPFGRLRAFAIDGLGEDRLPAVLAIVRRAPIEQLRITNHQLAAFQLRLLLAAAHALRALEIDPSPPLELVMERPLCALRIGGVERRDRESFERCRNDRLRHLSIASDTPDWAFDVLSRFTGLRSLMLDTNVAGMERLVASLGDRLEQLALVIRNVDADVRATIDRCRERVAGELLDGSDVWHRYDRELVHESPEAMGALERPHCISFQPATLVRIDADEQLWDIARMPIERRVYLGRLVDNVVRIPAASIGRRHALLEWNGDHHEIRDMGSANGTLVNGALIQQTALRDGDRIQLGDVVLQYFFGDDARLRGEVVLTARRRAAVFLRVVGIVRDARCDELAARVKVEPPQMLAVANAFADCLVRRVLACAGRYATYDERPALRALAPIRDRATRQAARVALANERGLGQAGSTSMALDLIDELEQADETARDATWQRLFGEAGPMFMAVARAQSAGITELPQLLAEMLESIRA